VGGVLGPLQCGLGPRVGLVGGDHLQQPPTEDGQFPQSEDGCLADQVLLAGGPVLRRQVGDRCRVDVGLLGVDGAGGEGVGGGRKITVQRGGELHLPGGGGRVDPVPLTQPRHGAGGALPGRNAPAVEHLFYVA
jgi:hypothetical protein